MTVSEIDAIAYASFVIMLLSLPAGFIGATVIFRRIDRSGYRTAALSVYGAAVLIIFVYGLAYGSVIGAVPIRLEGTAGARPYLFALTISLLGFTILVPVMVIRSYDLLQITVNQAKDIEFANAQLSKQNKELKLSKKTLKVALQTVEENQRMQDQFVANVSHELRTPLGVVYGYAQLGETKEEPDDAWSIVLSAAGRMRFLIDNILGTTSLEAGKAFEKSVFLLPRVVAESIRGMDVIARAAKVSINLGEFEYECVEGSEPLILLMLNNLISNSIKFNEPGGEVFVSGKVGERYHLITVRDTGVGMDDDVKRVMFTRFVQGDGSNTRKYTGVGLGLHFVKLVVDVHNGRIQVLSTPGEGTTFTVAIPKLGEVEQCQ